MKKIIKSFVLRGLIFSGFGPLIVSIVYAIIGVSTKENLITTNQFLLSTLSSYLLAFIVAGCSILYQIEKLSLLKSSLIHSIALYITYLSCYLINSWIQANWLDVFIFTSIFVVGYFIIWISIYTSIKITVKKLNEKIK